MAVGAVGTIVPLVPGISLVSACMPCAGASFWDTLPMSAPGASDASGASQLFRNTDSGNPTFPFVDDGNDVWVAVARPPSSGTSALA